MVTEKMAMDYLRLLLRVIPIGHPADGYEGFALGRWAGDIQHRRKSTVDRAVSAAKKLGGEVLHSGYDPEYGLYYAEFSLPDAIYDQLAGVTHE